MPIGLLSIPAVIARVREDARRRGVRWTAQRQTIVETFFAGREHLTVEELHKRVRAIDQSVSAATVYRTVNMLVEIGVAHKRHFGNGSASFESALDRDHHDHLVCMVCGKISEFHQDAIEALQDEVAKTHGFRLIHHRMELYGICAACQASGAEIPAPVPSETTDRR